jgi:hypothetical protein
LYAAHAERFTHDASKAEPTLCAFKNPYAAQPLQWVVHCAGEQPVKGVALEINGRPLLGRDGCALPAGGNLKYTGGAEAIEYDSTWKELSRVPVAVAAAQVGAGEQQVAVRCNTQSGCSLKIELRTLGPGRPIGEAAAK